jgi:hypothetical protein
LAESFNSLLTKILKTEEKYFNPLTAGIERIGLGHFLNCPYKKPVNLKFEKKYLFLGKCISYHLSLGDFLEKCRFPSVLGAFLGLIQKSGSIRPARDDYISSVILRHSQAPAKGRMDRIYVMYSQSVLGNPSRGRDLHTAAILKMSNLKCVFLEKYLTDFLS